MIVGPLLLMSVHTIFTLHTGIVRSVTHLDSLAFSVLDYDLAHPDLSTAKITYNFLFRVFYRTFYSFILFLKITIQFIGIPVLYNHNSRHIGIIIHYTILHEYKSFSEEGGRNLPGLIIMSSSWEKHHD